MVPASHTLCVATPPAWGTPGGRALRPLRILHISTRLILGGSQENTVLSCEGQARLGHEVHLAFGPIFGPEGSLLERVERFRTADGRRIATHLVSSLVREVSPMTDYRAYRELRALISALSPDVVHTHSSKAGIVGRWAAWDAMRAIRAAGPAGESGAGAGPRVVHTIHGPPFMPADGTGLERVRTRLSNAVYTLAERSAARRCHAIVSVADAMTRQFLARGIGEPSQFTTVYSGMETGPFLDAAPGEDRESVRAELGLSPGDFVVGTVARLAEHKGHDDLLDALSGDLRTHRHWKLLWVGDGWWRARLIERAKVLGLAVSEVDKLPTRARARAVTPSRAQLVLTGLVPPGRIPGLVRAMDVLAHPSLREGLPRTVPQALLAGVCPVAYDADGTGEACREMQTGRLVRVGDRDGLRDAVRWLHDHPDERRRLAERGREECRVKFDAGTMVAELEKVYTPSEQPEAVQPLPA